MLSFTPGSLCNGGSHFHVTVHLGHRDVEIDIGPGADLEEPTLEDDKKFARRLLGYLMRRMPDQSPVAIRAKLRTFSIGDPT